jgi:Mor family transcriptional regulator
MIKLSIEQQMELISDDSIHAAFLRRDDIAPLPHKEQERLWQEHLTKVNYFRKILSECDSIIIPAI